MADEIEQRKKENEKSTWEKIPFFAKLILAMLVIGILYFMIWGSNVGADVLGFIIRLFILGTITFLAYFLVKRFFSFFEPKPFSPKENLHTRIVNLAAIAVPPNINGKRLFTVGAKAFRGSAYGTITGFLKIPYFIGKIKRDEKGQIVFLKDEKGMPTKIPERDFIQSAECEYFFTLKVGSILPKFIFVRAHQKYVLNLDGDVLLQTSNLVPVMSSLYVYPYEQIFEDASRIMLQNMQEIIITTFDHQHDLISATTEHALSFNPNWEYAKRMSQESMGVLER